MNIFALFNPLAAIGKELGAWHARKLAAENDADRIAAEVNIAQLEARQAALIGGGASWVSKLVQALWAAPFVIYTWKLVVWDKVFKLGVTDPLSPSLENQMLIIVGFYFLAVSGKGIAAAIRR